MSVTNHRQDDHDVPHDGEHDEEGQHHAHRHRPAEVQRGGVVVLRAVGAVDGGVGAQRGRLRPGEKIRGGAVSPQTHGEEGCSRSSVQNKTFLLQKGL